MTAAQLLRLAFEVGSELWREHRRAKAAERAAQAWAETPAPTRGCPQCREIAYSPGQTTCFRCGARL